MKKTFAIAALLSATSMASAHAQTYSGQPGASYQTYAVQNPAGATSVSNTPATSYQTSATDDAAAAPFAPISTRILSDPLYLPLQGQVYGSTAYTFGMPTGDNYKGGAETGSFSSDNNLIEQTLEYGVLNDLTLRMSMGYGIDEKDSTTDRTGATSTGDSRGFSDPAFGITYRVLDQNKFPVTFDVAASYAPNLIQSQTQNGGSAGTIARGGSLSTMSLTLGREMKSLTIAGIAEAEYSSQQKSEVLASSSYNTTTDGYWLFGTGLETEYRFSNRISIDGDILYSSDDQHDVDNPISGTHTSAGLETLAFSTALNYHFIPNRLVGSITYTYDDYMNSNNTFASSASDTSIENYQGNTVGARLLYVFN